MKGWMLPIVLLAIVASTPALARGGTEAHEIASAHHDDEPTTGSIDCRRWRYHDPHFYGCIAPADLAH
jgi:hypothetical protein